MEESDNGQTGSSTIDISQKAQSKITEYFSHDTLCTSRLSWRLLATIELRIHVFVTLKTGYILTAAKHMHVLPNVKYYTGLLKMIVGILTLFSRCNPT